MRRARLALVAGSGLAVAIVLTQFPIGEILAQRGQLRDVSRQLDLLDERNVALRSENAALRQPATVAAIAHQDYGLVRPGQQAYVILPATGAADPDAASLGTPVISRSQMVSASASALTGVAPAGMSGAGPAAGDHAAGAGSAGQGSLLARTLDHLAFWRWAF